jgi:hypothetical protein
MTQQPRNNIQRYHSQALIPDLSHTANLVHRQQMEQRRATVVGAARRSRTTHSVATGTGLDKARKRWTAMRGDLFILPRGSRSRGGKIPVTNLAEAKMESGRSQDGKRDSLPARFKETSGEWKPRAASCQVIARRMRWALADTCAQSLC